MLGTVRKVAQVLDLFTPERPEWGVTEVSRALGIPKSTAHALMVTLCRIGFLRKTPAAATAWDGGCWP